MVILVSIVMTVIIVIVCIKKTKTKTMDKSNVINPQTIYYMPVSYIIDELPMESPQGTLIKTSPVSNEVD